MDSYDESRYFIYFAAFAASLINFGIGSTMSWTSPVLPKLQSNNTSINPISIPITIWEASLIASSLNIAALVTTIIGGVFWAKLGKKRTLMILNLPILGAHVLCFFASNVYMFIAARILMGITSGGVLSVLPAYLSEIAEVNKRGLVGSMFGAQITVGLTFAFIVGPFLSIKAFSLVNLVVPMLFLVLFGMFVPECPFDLIRRGQNDKAFQALMKLRGKPAHCLTKEFDLISTYNVPTKSRLVLLRHRGFFISIILIIQQQFTGICPIVDYMQSIFEAAGSSVPPIYASMIISTVQMVTNLTSLVLVDRAGRRPLLISSTIGCLLSLATFGCYFQVKALGIDVTPYGWLPLAALFVFFIAYNLGQANIPWIMSTELLPSNVKAISSNVVTIINLSLSSTVIFLFPSFSEWLGMAGSFFIFVAGLSVGLVFIVMMVPETKGKDYVEIQRLLCDV